MPLSDFLPDFSNPNSMAFYGGLGNMLMAGGMPLRGTGMGAGNALAMLAGAGMQGATAGAGGAQQFKQQDIANQTAQLGLQRQQAVQPYQLNMMKSMMGGTPGSLSGSGNSASGIGSGPSRALTPADQLGANALISAYASGDMKQISTSYLSLYEHNPALAGAIKQQQEMNTFQKTPQGTYTMPSQQSSAFGSPVPSMNASALQAPMQNGQAIQPPPPSEMGTQAPIQPVQGPQQIPSVPNQDQTGFAASPPASGPLANPQAQQSGATDQNSETKNIAKGMDGQPLMAGDGKPVLPSLANQPNYKPTSDGSPTLNTNPSSNTETGVKTQQAINDAQVKGLYAGDQTMTSSLSSLQKENYRIDQLMNIYQRIQAGTTVSQIPELANQLVSLGVITDPSTVKTVAGVQEAAANHILQIVQQIKDTNANLGTAPTRTFGAEISNMMDNGENAKNRPEALYNLLTQAKGLVAHQMDMAEGWQKIGGTGNTAANGKTMMPDQYAQQFMANHDPDDYRKNVATKTAPFKGMSSPNGKQIQLLKLRGTDPAVIQQFEQKFGPGSAKQFMGGQ